MPKAAHRDEIEIKLYIENLSALLALLKRIRAREITPRTYESNTLYDTSQQDLRRKGQLIRIRIERPASSLGQRRPIESTAAILTYKGPPIFSRKPGKTRKNLNLRGHFKIKEEAEVTVTGADEMAGILRGLGLHPVFRYEKFRTTFALPGIRGLKVELDETPVGVYLELEGPIASIDRGARIMGFSREDYLKDTYGSLYLAACRRRGQKPGNMLFPPTKKLQ